MLCGAAGWAASGEAEAVGDIGGEFDADGVAVVAGLVGDVAGVGGGREQFGAAAGQVQGFGMPAVAEVVGDVGDAGDAR